MKTLEELQKMTREELIEYTVSLQVEFEDFRSSSSELETMLDSEIQQIQKEAKEKERRLNLVETEFSRLQEKTQNEKKENVKIEENLRKEVASFKDERDTLRAKVRELEQKNDDLERTERNNQQEMEDLITKLNLAMERTSLLENEIAERQAASEEMYRLREELKERPKQVVSPLRMERTDETPDEPTPGKELPEVAKEPVSPRGQEVAEHETKSFSSRVNRIMKDLLVKVDLLEGVLTRMKQTSRP